MRIGITGRQGVGKTTLLHALKKEDRFIGYKILEEVVRDIAKLGLKVNTETSDLTQKVIMEKLVANILLYQNSISDRITLDAYAYTLWGFAHNQIDQSTVDFCNYAVNETLKYYDLIVYIKPEFPVEEDGFRDASAEFAEEMNKIFEQLINKYWSTTPIIIASGSVEDRVKQVLSASKVMGRIRNNV